MPARTSRPSSALKAITIDSDRESPRTPPTSQRVGAREGGADRDRDRQRHDDPCRRQADDGRDRHRRHTDHPDRATDDAGDVVDCVGSVGRRRIDRRQPCQHDADPRDPQQPRHQSRQSVDAGRSGTGDSLPDAADVPVDGAVVCRPRSRPRSRRAGRRSVTMIGWWDPMSDPEVETPASKPAPRRVARREWRPDVTWCDRPPPSESAACRTATPVRRPSSCSQAYDIPTMPSLPRRSPAESPIAQALIGRVRRDARSVRHGGDRRRAARPVGAGVDRPRPRPLHRVPHVPRGCRPSVVTPAPWHGTSPGRSRSASRCCVPVPRRARLRRGSRRRSRAHIRSLAAAVDEALPDSPQLVIIDEPFADEIFGRASPITPDEGVDLVVVGDGRRRAGRHGRRPLLLRRRPVAAARRRSARRVAPGVRHDRTARRVHRPLPRRRAAGSSGARSPPVVRSASPPTVPGTGSRRCGTTSCSAGARRSRLREQSLLTADCGLGSHGVPVAERISQSLRDIGRAVRSDATAAKLVLGG